MDEKKMILKMIEDGKITAEEGVKLLNALGAEDRPTEANTSKDITNTALSKKVDWDSKGSQKTSYKQASGTSFFTGFLESALQKIKDFDLDFNFGPSVEVEHIFQHTNFTGQKIDLSLENGSIHLIPWTENDIRLECNAKVYRVRDNEEARRVFFQEITFTATDDELKFYSKIKGIKLNVVCYIPEKLYEKVKLYTFNGHLKGEKLSCEKLDWKVVNGSIAISGLDTKKLALETVNGPIDVVHGKANFCEVKTVNGTITLEGSYLDSDIETVNGTANYSLKAGAERYYADIKATTGSVYVQVSEELAVEGKLKTNVGGFSCELKNLNIIEEKKEFVQKSLVFSANEKGNGTLKLTAETHTGSIAVKEK